MVRKSSLPNESILKKEIPSRVLSAYRVRPVTNKKDGQKGQCDRDLYCFRKTEQLYNPKTTILLMVYFDRYIFDINQK